MPNTNFNFTIIKTLRNARGKTLETLSKETGLSVRTISDIELNKAVPSVSSLIALAKSFNVSETDLFDIAQKSNPKILNAEEVKLKVTPNDPGAMVDLNQLCLIHKHYEKETEIKLEKQNSLHYPCYELIYVCHGSAEIKVEGEVYSLKAKESLHYASNLEHEFKFAADTTIIIFYLPRDNQIAKELASYSQYFNY